MSLNVQQISRGVVEGKWCGLNGKGESQVLSIWEHVGRTAVTFAKTQGEQ